MMRRESLLMLLGCVSLASPSTGASVLAPHELGVGMQAPTFGVAAVLDDEGMIRGEGSREAPRAAVQFDLRTALSSSGYDVLADAGGPGGAWAFVFREEDDLTTSPSAQSPTGTAGATLARLSAVVPPPSLDVVDGAASQPASLSPQPIQSEAATTPSSARDPVGSASVANQAIRPAAPEPAAILLALLTLAIGGLPLLIGLGQFRRTRRAQAPRAGGLGFPNLTLSGDRRSSSTGQRHRDRSRNQPSPAEFLNFLRPPDQREPDGD
jgi:hypothetical protein